MSQIVHVQRVARVRLDDPKQLRVVGVGFEDAKWFTTLPNRQLKQRALLTQRGQKIIESFKSFFNQTTANLGVPQGSRVVLTYG